MKTPPTVTTVTEPLEQKRMGEKKLPDKKFRAGAISATIWSNQGQLKTGEVSEYKSVTFERNYKDKEGVWKSTNSLRATDLPRAVVVLNKAYEHIVLTGKEEDVSA